MKLSQLRHAQVPEELHSPSQNSQPGGGKTKVWQVQSKGAPASKTLQIASPKNPKSGKSGSDKSPPSFRNKSSSKIRARASNDDLDLSEERIEAFKDDKDATQVDGLILEKTQDDQDDEEGETKLQLPALHDD